MIFSFNIINPLQFQYIVDHKKSKLLTSYLFLINSVISVIQNGQGYGLGMLHRCRYTLLFSIIIVPITLFAAVHSYTLHFFRRNLCYRWLFLLHSIFPTLQNLCSLPSEWKEIFCLLFKVIFLMLLLFSSSVSLHSVMEQA